MTGTDWGPEDTRMTYNLAHWSSGYFDIDDETGRLVAFPRVERSLGGVDLQEVTARIRAHGLSTPVLIRFIDILHHRVDVLMDAFSSATDRAGYRGRYTPVYPIKVNQHRSVVDEILTHGQDRVGLEAGSKPELMAVLGVSDANNRVIVCNGYKDREYIRIALVGRLLGNQVFIVVEKLSELDLVIEEAQALGVRPLLGVRVRLSSIGKGKWQNTGGEKSKFGLSAPHVLRTVERLREVGMLDSLRMLHFHLGSQVANILDIQRGMREAARYYAELRAAGVPIDCMDVGGGLGVDYEGTRSRSAYSMNYSVTGYAQSIIDTLTEICAEADLPHPDIITESGRGMTAHHAVLVTNVIDIERPPREATRAPVVDDPQVLHHLYNCWSECTTRSAVESYHDAMHWNSVAQDMYTHGLLTLAQRALAEELYFATCHRVRPLLKPATRAHRDILDELNEKLAEKLFCNFSVFQSIPDVWAIDQIFPVMPLSGLDRCPEARAVILDITCDSDGRMDHYVDRGGVETTLPLRLPEPGEDYLIGIFMVGAYQEILGDMHNLFGDTHSVNVVLDGRGGYRLAQLQAGDTVDSVLRHVHFEPRQLLERLRAAVAAGQLDERRRALCHELLAAGLSGYTYLED